MRPFGKDCLLSILVELSIVAFIAAFLPLLIRYAALPTSVHHQYPLNVVFRTCDHDLHSVCSFPSATLEYEKNSLFSPNVAYYLNVRLKFADIASSKKLGFFQSVISITEENGKVVQQYTKSAYVKEPGLITKASQVFLFPLYILGYLYDYSTLTISMSENYLEQLGSPSTKLIFTVQDKFANIEEAELTVTARFGLIRHLIYYWPVMSYTAILVCGNVSVAMSMLSGHASTTQPACLGFCGRSFISTNYSEEATSTSSLSQCGACSFGYRSNATSICVPCETPLQAYDWMYLLFIALLPLLLHMQFIRVARKYCRTRYYEVSEYLCVILENVIACVISVLIYPPRFSFFLNGCEKTGLKEWYPACYNPKIGYTKTMRCTYEVVFPLYSITFVHHMILMGAIFTLRSILYCAMLYKAYNAKPYYLAIVSVPLLVMIHSVLSGLIFYSFPYILLIGSLWAMCFHLALEGKRPLKEMIVRLATSPTHWVFLTITMLMLSFGVVALITPLDIQYRWSLLCLVPVPLVFYLITIPFSNPATTMRLI
ncbi:Protein CBR-JAMP-1 [Caenorhabditis briggsae]|uniref:Protein CBR-JAMP-1 n=3 Tax=Caenorhabditis briggsae TaxID=6238 RepID=A8X9I3_CAEBR|nr:Protein CBR-JAMP-1 [Caenorhabditis briggsae]ULT90148.1 hypothetical protein L3Y34_008489 [Caenorhabditis briggsae]CAP29295.1 Protein CBR-JAMP-1 [Caenorhabditis briggsae]